MKLRDAFNYMVQLIDSGVEFSDAQWKASNKFRVSSDALAEMYDQQYS
jgi:hypothetical protein